MKKNIGILLIIAFCVLACNFVSAESNSCKLEVTMVTQDPYPATPGDYVTLVFQVDGVQDVNCEGASFELLESYPFSLDEGEYKKAIEGSTWDEESNVWMISYKLRVDEDALDGTNEIEVQYKPGYIFDEKSVITKAFDVEVEDARTNFEAVIQDSTNSEVSIAIANIGKNTANSVIVKIPEQEYFETTGSSGQMVGNLESGDYTIVSFNLNGLSNSEQNLIANIEYTDNIGERRIQEIELPLTMGSNSMMTTLTDTESSSGTSNIWFLVAIALVLIIGGIIVYNLYNKNKKDKKKKGIPDWVKNANEKENK